MMYNVADLFSCLNDGPEILYARRSPKSFEDPDCKDLIVEGCENVEKWLIDNQNDIVNNFEIELTPDKCGFVLKLSYSDPEEVKVD